MLQSISNIFKSKVVQPSVLVDNGDYILSKDQFIVFQTAFKRLAQAKEITAEDMVLYNILRNKPIDHGFTPITNKTKLFNGMQPRLGFTQAKNELRHKIRVTGCNLVKRFDNFVPFNILDGNGSRMDQLYKSNPRLMKIYDKTN